MVKNTPKKSQKADRKGAGGGLTVSLTVKYPFFTASLNQLVTFGVLKVPRRGVTDLGLIPKKYL